MDEGGHATTDERAPWDDLRLALLWLASPLTVLSLFVLAVNDHVLKQAHPGLVTGKLSDLAGLVVAPALLAVVLGALRVPRPREMAIVATGTGFAMVKTWQPATDLANQVWSSTGDWSTQILRDPTDLVALPALAVAVCAARVAARPRSLKARARLAVGAVVLPFAVVTTAATSCGTASGVTFVALARGDFTGGATRTEEKVLAGRHLMSLDDEGEWAWLPAQDERRLEAKGDWYGTGWLSGEYPVEQMCSVTDPDLCWRGHGTTVKVSVDAGRTWQDEYQVPDDELRDVHDDRDNSCGPADVGVRDLAVLDTTDGQLVVVAADNAGLLLRNARGDWRRVGMDDLEDLPTSAPDVTAPAPSGDLFWRDPRPEPPVEVDGSSPWDTPTTSTPGVQVTIPCPSPTTVRVRPDPRNGPPFDRVECPP